MRAMTSLVEHSSDVISFLSPAGRILYASESAGKLFGYRPEEIVGRNTFDLIHPEDRRQARRALAAVLPGPLVPRRLDVRLRRKDGGWCWVESTVTNLLHEPRFNAIVVNCRHIGETRMAREKAQKQTDDLVVSNARLEDFACEVAHDLREPLRTISMFTELLLEDSVLDA
jgi:PAS domain S-box-containing protein